MTTTKKPFSARLSDEAHTAIDDLAAQWDCTQTKAVERAVLERALKESVEPAKQNFAVTGFGDGTWPVMESAGVGAIRTARIENKVITEALKQTTPTEKRIPTPRSWRGPIPRPSEKGKR